MKHFTTMESWMIFVSMYCLFLTLSESRSCPDVLFEFNDACFAECPEFTKHITGSNVCTKMCPDTAPIVFKGTCINQCPDGYHSSDKRECIKLQNQQNITKSYYSLSYRGCPSSYHCIPSRPFCYKLQCFKTCPKNTKSYGLQCVDICPKDVPFVFNRTCVKKCPSTHKFIINNDCFSSCGNGFNTYGRHCVKSCPHNTFLFNSQCLARCPDTDRFVATINNVSVCHKKCPALTASNGYICEHFCPDSRPFLFNRTCVTSCPITQPYLLYKETEMFALSLCLDSCPQDRFIDGHVCVKKCTDDSKLLDYTCVKECPNNRSFVELVGGFQTCVANCSLQNPYLSQNKCLSACHKDMFILNSYFCVNDCPASKPLADEQLECVDKCQEHDIQYQNKCLSHCPKHLKEFETSCIDNCNKTTNRFEMKIDGQTSKCLSKCPENTFINAFDCVLECPWTSKYVLNKTCYSKCPQSHPYHREYHYQYSDIVKSNVCLKTCGADEYRFKDRCLQSCSRDLKEFGSECVEDCKTTSKPLQYYVSCVDDCPWNMLNNSFKCVQHCPASARYVFNKTCHSSCPKLYPLYSQDSGADGNYKCVASCNKFKLINTSICLEKCLDGTFQHQSSCVYKCPGDRPFISIDKKCVSSCSLYLNKSCMDVCPAKMCKINKTCVSVSNSKLIYMKAIGNNYLNVCVDACPKGTIQIGQICVDHCPKPYVYFSNSCQNQCPSAYPFIEDTNQGSECVKICSYNKVNFDAHCQERCPSDTFMMPNRTCVRKCAKFLPYIEETSSGKECKETCDKTKYYNGNSCVSQCPWHKLWVLNKTCVLICPPTHFRLNKECLLDCSGENVQVYNLSECIKKTDCIREAKFILDNYCVDTCPNGKIPKEDGTCVSIYYVYNYIFSLLFFPVIGLCICWCCNGNCSIYCRIPWKQANKYQHIQADTENEETCVMEIATSDSTGDVTLCRRESNSTDNITSFRRDIELTEQNIFSNEIQQNSTENVNLI